MATNTTPTVDNLKIAQGLVQAMSQMADILDKQTESLKTQLQLSEAIKKVQELTTDDIRNRSFNGEALNEALEKSLSESESLAESMTNVGKTVEKSTGLVGAFGKVASGVFGTVVVTLDEMKNGFQAGFNISKNFFGNIWRMGRTAVGVLVDIAKVVAGMPGAFLEFMQGAATGGVDAYRVALEELREEFGNLATGTSLSVRSMNESMRNFSATGLSFGRVFGYGREGLAAALKEFQKIATEMGPIFNRFAADSRGMSREIVVLAKGANITGEGFRAMQLAADNGGESIRVAMNGMIRGLAMAEREFGIASKEIGKDVNAMLKDLGSFGVMSRDTMIKTSVYARRLGLSIETLKKVMDKYLNFEDAAQSAAGMAEAFNMNIDAMRMMREQDPTRRLDMLRQAFFRTGRNIDQMSIAERRHLANLSGMSEEETRIAFAQRNRALSGAQLDAQMRRSQRQQMTQVQALQQVAKSIKLLVLSGNPLQGSFFDIFIRGFKQGIMWSREFRGAVRAIQQSMRVIFMSGREVGRMFAHLFPGFKEFFGGVRDLFNPRRYRALMTQVKAQFREFFTSLSDPNRRDSALGTFMRNMRTNFLNYFTQGSPAARRTAEGFKTFFKTIGILAIQGARYLLVQLRDGTKKALDAVRAVLLNPRGIRQGLRELFAPGTNVAGTMGSQLTSTFQEVFQYAASQLGPVLGQLWDTVVGFISDRRVQQALEDKLGPPLRKAGQFVGKYFIAAMFGPAVIMAAIRGAGAIIAQAIGKALFPVAKSAFAGFSLASTAAAAVLASVAALTVGFDQFPDRTARAMKRVDETVAKLSNNIGLYMGKAFKAEVEGAIAVGFLLTGYLFDPGRWLTAVGRLTSAVVPALMSVGNTVITGIGNLVAGFLEGAGLQQAANDLRTSIRWVSDGVHEFVGDLRGNMTVLREFFGSAINTAIADLTRLGDWVNRHNPFTVVMDSMQAVWNTAQRIFGHSVNTVVAADLARIERPAQRAQETISNALQTGFNNASQASRTGADRIVRNVNAATQATQTLAAAGQQMRDVQAGNINNSGALVQMFGQMREVVAGLVTFATDTFRNMTPSQAGVVRTGVETVAAMLNAVKTVPEIVAAVGSGPNVNPAEMVNRLVGPNGLLSYLFITQGPNAHQEARWLLDMFKADGVIDRFVAQLPTRFERTINKIKTLFETVKSMSDAATSLSSAAQTGAGGNVYNNVISPLVGANGLLSYLFDESKHREASDFKSMFKSGGLIQSFADSMPDSYRRVTTKLASIGAIVRSTVEASGELSTGNTRISSMLTGLNLQSAMQSFRTNFTEQISAFVSEYNRISIELANLNVHAIDASLDRVGEVLGADRTVRLESAAANVTVNVNVKLAAADIEQALFEYSNSPRARNRPGTLRPTSFYPRTEPVTQ